ncbi:uncharacterized protein LOC143909878 [Arctopsyche grandis]|uniref:uncharacterized protein LOC143909878 n=1 Tax=Arctopsyche grandis TaxID=121162 RepID=UPI00406D6E4F
MTSQNSYPPQIFVRDYVKTTHDHAKYYNAFVPKNKNPMKIWIIGSIVCLLICVVIVSIIIWYSISDTSNDASILSENLDGGKSSDMFLNNFYEQQNFHYFKENSDYNNHVDEKVNKTQNSSLNTNATFGVNTTNKNSIDRSKNKKNESEILSNIEFGDESSLNKVNASDKFSLKSIVIGALGTLSSVALGTNKLNIQHTPIGNNDKKDEVSSLDKKYDYNSELQVNSTEYNDNIKIHMNNVSAKVLSKHMVQNETKTERLKDSNINNEDIIQTRKPVDSKSEKKNYVLDNSVLNYLNGFISANERIQDITMDNTQISSPDDSAGQVTTNLVNLLNEDIDETIEKQISTIHRPLSIKSVNNSFLMQIPDSNFTFQGLLTILKSGLVKSDENYYDQDYLYSENDAQNFYYDYEQVTWANYFLEKIQELYDWIITDMELEDNGTISKGNQNAPLPQILRALNYSLLEGDASILLLKIKDLYYTNNSTDFDAERNKKILANTSSVLSFGLLALDVLLLRNIQLIAWDNQETANSEVLNDLEVFAFNALFMDPIDVKRIHEVIKKSKHQDVAIDQSKGKNYHALLNGADLTSSFYKNINIGEELYNFITSTARAVMNLGYAFRRSRKQLGIDMKDTETNSQVKLNMTKLFDSRRSEKIDQNVRQSTEIDCIWTLYCKNLEKATKLDGVYGFLAKLNGIGLRLLLGELSAESALETLFKDTLSGPKNLHCEKMFPKCDEENASRMILEEIISRASLKD